MTDLETIVLGMLAERASQYGFAYPSGAASQIIQAGEHARRETVHHDGRRTAGILAMEAELQRIEQTLSFPRPS